MQGSIKFFNEQKGFGFIMPEDGSQDIFFHITQCEESYELPQEGDVVTYDGGEGRDGRPAATNVCFVGQGSTDVEESTEEAGDFEDEAVAEEATDEVEADESEEEAEVA